METKVTWDIIPPEIKNDPFYHSIINLIQNSEDIHNILEIGASSGDGSTEAFQIGKKNKNIKLFSIEVCTERFNVLKARYDTDPNFYPYNISSINHDEFPHKNSIIEFYNTENTNLNNFSLETVLGWYDQDIRYIKSNGIMENGIELVKCEHNLDTFDCVLIDGSEFTGLIEYNHIRGAKYILLDDINTYKTFKTNELLASDPQYKCLCQNNHVRNGFAIYKRK
jgi:hypothetical protein